MRGLRQSRSCTVDLTFRHNSRLVSCRNVSKISLLYLIYSKSASSMLRSFSISRLRITSACCLRNLWWNHTRTEFWKPHENLRGAVYLGKVPVVRWTLFFRKIGLCRRLQGAEGVCHYLPKTCFMTGNLNIASDTVRRSASRSACSHPPPLVLISPHCAAPSTYTRYS
jgi:hypothetical protein